MFGITQSATRAPYAFVLIDGTATLSDDLDEIRAWATRLGGRYMGEDKAEAFGQRNGGRSTIGE